MDKPAAFRAAYSDLRFIKSRKVAQIVLELPLEAADAFIAAFGSPNPAVEKWVAIARLIERQPEEKEHKAWDNLRPSAQAGIRCADALFQQFLVVSSAENAAARVRWACDVKSRSELDRDSDARAKWEKLDEQFIEWKRRHKL